MEGPLRLLISDFDQPWFIRTLGEHAVQNLKEALVGSSLTKARQDWSSYPDPVR